jgi:hypothetical protein
MPWLEEHHPDLVPRYRDMYRQAYGPKSERDRLGARVGALVRAARKRWPEVAPPPTREQRFGRSGPKPQERSEQATLW